MGPNGRRTANKLQNHNMSSNVDSQRNILDISLGFLHLAGNSLVSESMQENYLQDARVLQQVDKKSIPIVVGGTLAVIDQPDHENEGMDFQVGVEVLNEENLCVMCNYEQFCVDLWVFKEYGEKESWFKMCLIQGIEWIAGFMLLRPFVYSKDSDKLLLEVNDEKLMWYDWKNKHAKVVNIHGGPKFFDSKMYVGSLIRINDHRDGWKKQQELDEEKKRKTNRKNRDDFVSLGFKLKL